MPHGITSLATHTTSTYYWILGKSPLKPKISLYLIQLHWLVSHGPQGPYFKRQIYGPHFLFINWDHNPWHHQHQHMDRAQAINENSWPILPLSYSWKVASPTKTQYLHKMTTKSKVRHLIFSYDPSLWVFSRKLWESWLGRLRSMFNKVSVI